MCAFTANEMFRRLGVALIALVFSLGLLTGLGLVHAAASPALIVCHSQAANHAAVEIPSPGQACDGGAEQTACLGHVSCVAFLVPSPSVIESCHRAVGWRPVRPSRLDGANVCPDTRPPIASV